MSRPCCQDCCHANAHRVSPASRGKQIPRATSVHAIRDTELVRIPACTFEWVKRVQPFVLEHFSRVLGSKLLEAYSRNGTLVNAEEPSSHSNLASIVLIPATPDVPLTAFASALTVALSRVGRARHLNADKVGAELGVADFRRSDTYRLVQWLSHQEEKHRLVVYEADATLTGWTDRCIRQADLILIVGLGAGEPAVSPIESVLGHYRSKAFVELVLLHEATVRSPRRTVEWLNNRDWVSGHHHIRCSDFLLYGHAGRPAPPTGDSDSDGEAGGAAASPGTSPGQPRKGTRLHPDDEETDDEVRAAAARRWADPTNHMSDYGRLARRIMGTSIGLALGGGGARGCAHIGIIRALHEAGIPIDVVSGTSMGSFVGALYAEEMDWAAVRDRTAHYCRDMDKLWPKVVDLTYPTTSMLSGAWFNDVIRSVFHRKQIEDLWIPYFAVSTDISANATRAHKHGRLWRYVRASMTLSGYLPPMCDPVDGHYLLDGGYTDNLPGAIINRFGAEHIFCVHVAALDDAELFNYGDRLSGWWLLWNKSVGMVARDFFFFFFFLLRASERLLRFDVAGAVPVACFSPLCLFLLFFTVVFAFVCFSPVLFASPPAYPPFTHPHHPSWFPPSSSVIQVEPVGQEGECAEPVGHPVAAGVCGLLLDRDRNPEQRRLRLPPPSD